MKVFITRKIPQAGIDILEAQGYEIKIWSENRTLTPEELIENCQGMDALLSAGPNKINRSFLQACKHLKVIALHSVGYDQVDVEAANEFKIPIGNTPGVLSGATADTAFLLMLAVSRKAFFLSRKIVNGEWGFFEPTRDLGIELNGKTLGVFGLGKIGLEMARKCKAAYHMNVIYYNRGVNEEAEKELNARKVSVETLLAESDVLTVHTALTDETRGFFNSAAFNQMKPSSIFINTARGSIHNEQDLIEALQQKKIWGAGLDVTNPEPMLANNPLLEMPSVAVLPHIGSATEETRIAMAKLAAENIVAALSGKRLPHIVNPAIYL